MKHRLHLIGDDLREGPELDPCEQWIGDMVRRFEDELWIYYMTRYWG